MPIIDLSSNIRTVRKEWFKKSQDRDPFAKNISSDFIASFLERSGMRDCNCKDAYPKFSIEQYPTGESYAKISCSVCKGQFYKYVDFYFVMLILGRKGGGKTTSVFNYVDLIHQIDGFRKIKLWQCPQNLIAVLHNLKLCNYYHTVCERAIGEMKWRSFTPLYHNPDEAIERDERGNMKQPSYQSKEEMHRVCKFNEYKTSEDCRRCPNFQLGKPYFLKIDRLDQVEFNDILIIDEGIISLNAKEALSKKMRNFDKFLAVARHFRCCLFVLFQRYEVIKSLREMSDMILYKSLPENLIENEKYDQIIKTHGKKIVSLKRNEGLLVSSHQDFRKTGMVMNKVPEWYTDQVSMSYAGDISFVSEKDATEKELERAKEMAQWLIDQNFPEMKPSEFQKAARFKLQETFNPTMIPPPNTRELTMAINGYYSMTLMDGLGNDNNEEFIETMVKDEENLKMFEELAQANMTKKDLAIFDEFCKGKSVTEFDKEPYNTPKQRVTEIVRQVGSYYIKLLKKDTVQTKTEYRDGEEVERKVVKKTWENNEYALRSVGSGGDRGSSPSPDLLMITKDGYVRPIQVKERKMGGNLTFQPLTFNTEFKIINRLRKIASNTNFTCPHCKEHLKGFLKPDNAWLYVCSKEDTESFITEPLEYSDNKKTLRIDWNHRQIIRQNPEIGKLKSELMIEFLKSDQKIYWGNTEIPKEEKELTEKEEPDIVDSEKLNEIYNKLEPKKALEVKSS